jgi:hypothetical protein
MIRGIMLVWFGLVTYIPLADDTHTKRFISWFRDTKIDRLVKVVRHVKR